MKLLLISVTILPSLLRIGEVTAQGKKDSIPDSITVLSEVKITGYLHDQKLWQTPASVTSLSKRNIELHNNSSLVSAMNSVPGVRMEERSPGSYRLSIRGSLVRSPYGVRNVKVYYNDFALTDAGGNTYLNVLNVNDINGIEILKGPDGSLFGANSGGVVLLKSNTDTLSSVNAKLYGGSFGLFGEAVQLSKNSGKHFFSFRESYQQSDGYRENTKNHRLFLQASDAWNYAINKSLEVYAFYSDLAYRTPGALTLAQYENNPKMARLATATLPSALEQNAGISSKLLFAGARHKMKISPYMSHSISVWSSHVDFENPAISNLEHRNENNLGIRIYFTLQNKSSTNTAFHISMDVGFEGQKLVSDINNYDNNRGLAGNQQAYSNILTYQYFEFVRGRLNWEEGLILDAAVYHNNNGYHFRDIINIKNNFKAVWMPHFGLNYKIADPVSFRITVSKGYSTPTTAEVRPANNIIYANLQSEQGWNTEVGFRLSLLCGKLTIDASAYQYSLKNGIVSQVDNAGNPFFVNSGEIKQKGLEAAASWVFLLRNGNALFFKRIEWNSSYTYAYYYYGKYMVNSSD
jgi:iron complex outermembrane receptor protein